MEIDLRRIPSCSRSRNKKSQLIFVVRRK